MYDTPVVGTTSPPVIVPLIEPEMVEMESEAPEDGELEVD